MGLLRLLIRTAFDAAESVFGRAFAAEWNPLLNLGALGFLFYWVVSASGVYLFIFFDTGITEAYASIEAMTVDQWYAAGVMRSLHRYASDALILVVLLHILREFGRDRYRGVRWLSWVTGIPVLVLIYVAGITGYWLVWDKLAQYVAIVSTEWFDKLGIFGQPIARNFLSPAMLDSRFFSLMIFMHIAVPLIALGILWLHLQRITKPRINPPRGLAVGTLLSLLMLSLIHPAVSQEPANLAEVPGRIGLDWFYLPAYPLLERLPGPVTWSAGLLFLGIMAAIPWLPPMRKAAVARVDLANCNGCRRCFNDCPYNAIAMVTRSDGRPFEGEAAVNPSLCVSCGICAGSCPTATPFRRMSKLVPGIDLPDLTIAAVRELANAEGGRLIGRGRIMVFGCTSGVDLDAARSDTVGIVGLNCIGQLPPSFIDYVLSRRLADGVVLTGCAANSCQHRFGIRWTEARLARQRDPHLRARVPGDRIRTLWAGRGHTGELSRLLHDFGHALAQYSQTPPAAARLAAGETVDA
jgi:ferredoxin/coenzyme F420-reducing hydrogenase delta subunit